MKNKIIAKNKKAYHDYEVIEKIEAGIVLKGSEVKSIRDGRINLKGSFCKFFKEELFAFDIHISKYKSINSWEKDINETRDRKLLLKKQELKKLKVKIEEKGFSIIPLEIYFNKNNICKMKIGLCKGLKNYEKREVEKKKEINQKIKKEYGFSIK